MKTAQRTVLFVIALLTAASLLAFGTEKASGTVFWRDGVKTTVQIDWCSNGSSGKFVTVGVDSQRYQWGPAEDPQKTYVRIWVYDNNGSGWLVGPSWYPITTGFYNTYFQARVFGLPMWRYVAAEYYRVVNGVWRYEKEAPAAWCYV